MPQLLVVVGCGLQAHSEREVDSLHVAHLKAMERFLDWELLVAYKLFNTTLVYIWVLVDKRTALWMMADA